MSTTRLIRTTVAAALLALCAFAPGASAASSTRAVVLVSGVAATTPFTTPTQATRGLSCAITSWIVAIRSTRRRPRSVVQRSWRPPTRTRVRSVTARASYRRG